MRTPSGFFFGLIGGLLILSWMGALMFGPGSMAEGRALFGDESGGAIGLELEGSLRVFLTQLLLMAFGVLSLFSAFNSKGLYLPKGEVHALLSAPISSADLVRYRLLVDAGKTAASSMVFVALFWGRLPKPGFGVFGLLLALFTITILSRASSLALGNTNLWLGRFFRGRSLGRLGFLFGAVAWAVMIFFMVKSNVVMFGLDMDIQDRLRALAAEPIVAVLVAPARPFAELVLAERAADFLLWLAIDIGLLICAFELCARSAGEIREASMSTSEELAKRLGAIGKGHSGVSALGRMKRSGAQLRRVPRVFGRGKVGTIAWAQLVGVTRFSLGTFLLCFAVVGFLVFVTVNEELAGDLGSPRKELMISTALIVVLGTMYLGTSMRFDFRTSLSRLESIKSWPLSARRLFFATVLPQALIMTLLLLAGVASRLVLTGTYDPVLFYCASLVPAYVYAWVALDNAVFLWFPVKFIPGQDGAVHHMGRSMLLLFLRVFLLASFGAVLAATLFLLSLVSESLGMGAELAEDLGYWLLLLGVLAGGALFSLLGGLALRHYDVSKSIS